MCINSFHIQNSLGLNHRETSRDIRLEFIVPTEFIDKNVIEK